MTEDQAVLTAACWWRDQIEAGLTEQQLANFQSKLEEFIYSEIATDLTMGYDGASVWIYCGDYPCKLLGYAAVQARISESVFPKHVDMVIESCDGGEHYEVRIYDTLRRCYRELCPINDK